MQYPERVPCIVISPVNHKKIDVFMWITVPQYGGIRRFDFSEIPFQHRLPNSFLWIYFKEQGKSHNVEKVVAFSKEEKETIGEQWFGLWRDR